MRARALASDIARLLADAGVDEAAFEAEYLLRTAARLSRAAYFLDPEIAPEEAARAQDLAGRRCRREPAAYIVGSREFRGLDFGVSRRVLVPRPETELLVDLALAEAARTPRAHVLDVGTGSGAIAVAVALGLPPALGARVSATEVSPAALAVARENARRHHARVDFVLGDLATAVASADIVVANLPYIPSDEIDALEPEVSAWEPRVALDGGPDGFALVRRLVADCALRLRPAVLGLEVGYGMAPAAAGIASDAGAAVVVQRDLAGIERVVVARWA